MVPSVLSKTIPAEMTSPQISLHRPIAETKQQSIIESAQSSKLACILDQETIPSTLVFKRLVDTTLVEGVEGPERVEGVPGTQN
jgi:hypothetical protein